MLRLSKAEIAANIEAGQEHLEKAAYFLLDGDSRNALQRAGLYDPYRVDYSRMSSDGSQLDKRKASVKFYQLKKMRQLSTESSEWKNDAKAYLGDIRLQSVWAKLGLKFENGVLVDIGPRSDAYSSDRADAVHNGHDNASADENSDTDSDAILAEGGDSPEVSTQGDAPADHSSDIRSLHSVSSSIFGNPWLRGDPPDDLQVENSAPGVMDSDTPVVIAVTTGGSEENRTDEPDRELLGLLVLRNF